MKFVFPCLRFVRRRLGSLFSVMLLLSANSPAAVLLSFSHGNPLLQRQYAPGSEVTLSPTPVPTGQLQWFHDDSPITGATHPSLTLTNLSPSDSGNYRLRVTSGSAVEFSETLTINVLPFSPSPVDQTFSVPSLDPARVTGVGPFAHDGSFVINTVNAADEPRVVRLSENGALVGSFALSTSAGFALSGFPDGSLITARAPFRANANGEGLSVVLPAGFDSSQRLSAALALSGGRFLLAQQKQLARFNSDGSIDATFTYTPAANRLTTIESIQVDPAGRIYLGGWVENPVPTNIPSNWMEVIRLKSDGSFDTGFKPQTASPILSGSLLVVPLDNGRILYHSAYHGYRQWHLLLDDGTPDPTWTGTSTYSDRLPMVNRATGEVYIGTSGMKLLRYRVTATSLVEDDSFYSGVFPFRGDITFDLSGRLLVNGAFTQWDGHPTYQVARVRANDPLPPFPPNVTLTVHPNPVIDGATVKLSTLTSGTGPFTYQWFALDGQSLPADTTAAELTLPGFSTANFGRYQVRMTGVGGVAVLSNVVELTYSNDRPYLANLSGRAMTGSGENTVIAGLSTKVQAGSLGVSTLLRGVGPALEKLGVSNFLPNPSIDLYDSSGRLIAQNDQWSTNPQVAEASAKSGAFAFAAGSNDAGMTRSFPTGNATVMLRKQDGTDGVGLIEIYQLFPNGEEYRYQSLLNLSFRARTAPGEGVAIAGFVITDPQGFSRTARVVLRAIGPTLAAQGISQPLQDPVLTVFNSRGEIVAQNDDWAAGNASADATTLSATMKQVGAFELPASSKDSALMLDLPAGAYTMHATGGTGVVLMEIYIVQ